MRCHMAQDLGTAARCGQVWGSMRSARSEASLCRSRFAPRRPRHRSGNRSSRAGERRRQRQHASRLRSQRDRQCVIRPANRGNGSLGCHHTWNLCARPGFQESMLHRWLAPAVADWMAGRSVDSNGPIRSGELAPWHSRLAPLLPVCIPWIHPKAWRWARGSGTFHE